MLLDVVFDHSSVIQAKARVGREVYDRGDDWFDLEVRLDAMLCVNDAWSSSAAAYLGRARVHWSPSTSTCGSMWRVAMDLALECDVVVVLVCGWMMSGSIGG